MTIGTLEVDHWRQIVLKSFWRFDFVGAASCREKCGSIGKFIVARCRSRFDLLTYPVITSFYPALQVPQKTPDFQSAEKPAQPEKFPLQLFDLFFSGCFSGAESGDADFRHDGAGKDAGTGTVFQKDAIGYIKWVFILQAGRHLVGEAVFQGQDIHKIR